jgi:NADH dehydrogenase
VARGVRLGARLVVVGAGFAGTSLVRHLPRPLRRPGETLLVDREETYAFIPLIHEVAVGRIHPDSICSPIPAVCKGRCGFLRANVTGVDLGERVLETSRGRLGYQYLVLATGSCAARPPEALAPHFQLFRSLGDALRLRAALAEGWRRATSPAREAREGDLTVVVAGGGATGVELSAEIAALFRYLGQRTARRPSVEPRVVLLEATDRLMCWLPPYFRDVAMEELSRLGVEVRLGTTVEEANEEGVRAGTEWLPTGVRIWTAGIEISGLIRDLPGKRDGMGRIKVDAHLTLPGHPEVYVLGDAGLSEEPRRGLLLPPTASVAVQQGPWAARDLGRRLRGRTAPDERPPFAFFDRGYVVSLGPESAAATVLGARLRGPAAQGLYRSIFLYYLNSRRDRILTATDWAMERTIGRLGFGVVSDQPRSRKPAWPK